MVDDDVKYETKSVQAIRGTEARAISKWKNQGWELVEQTPGKLRTTLNFRRPQPKKPWLLLAALGAVLAVILAIVGIVAAVQGSDDGRRDPAATATDSSAPDLSDTASDQTSQAVSQTPSDSPTEEAADQPLTATNSEDFAQVLTADYCSPKVKAFAAEYVAQQIEFDASIADMANHGSYDTRYDILIAPGDKGPNSVVGPLFKFEDVGMADLNLTGKVPDSIGTGDRLHVVAQVGQYGRSTCLFFLEPVSTKVR